MFNLRQDRLFSARNPNPNPNLTLVFRWFKTFLDTVDNHGLFRENHVISSICRFSEEARG